MCKTIIKKEGSCCDECSESGVTVQDISEFFIQLSFYRIDTCEVLNFSKQGKKRADCIYFIKKDKTKEKVYCVIVELKKSMQDFSMNDINDLESQFVGTKAFIEGIGSQKSDSEKTFVSLAFVAVTENAPRSTFLRQIRPKSGITILYYTTDQRYWKKLSQTLT